MEGEELHSKWESWIDGPIKQGVIRMHFYRQIWRGLSELIGRRGLPPSAYWQYHLEVYAETQAVAVRRQVDFDHRVASLGKLLKEIIDNPSAITGEEWIGRWEADDEGFARERWMHDFGDDSFGPIQVERAERDLTELRGAAADVKLYVDQKVAHSDWRAHKERPPALTLGALDAAIDAIGRMFRRYMDLVMLTDMQLEVVIGDDWLDPFRVAWAEPLPERHPRREFISPS